MGLVLMVLGFMWWWPLGLIILAALIANGRIGYRRRLQFAGNGPTDECDHVTRMDHDQAAGTHTCSVGPAVMPRPYRVDSSSGLRDTSSLDGSEVNLEQGLMLLPLLLILLSQPEDLSNDLYIESVALGFLKDLPLPFV